MNTNIIFKNLFDNPEYFIKVFGYLSLSDFNLIEEKALYTGILYLHDKYKSKPTLDETLLFFDTTSSVKNTIKKSVLEKLNEIKNEPKSEIKKEILVDSTEKFIRNVRTEHLLERGIKILEGEGGNDTIEKIQEDMKMVTQLSFSSSMGHDYFKESQQRFLEYGKMDERLVSSGIHLIDIAGGGKPKTLTVLLATSNSGKTMHMASWATNASSNGFNVAVFTMEDGEIGWSSRIDANIMNLTLTDMKEKNVALSTTFKSVVHKNMGRIKIKEFPTGAPTINNFKAVLQDWKIKDDFIPDIIFCDYIQIMSSLKTSGNGYENGKYVAEDIRSLAVELDIPVVSAAQGRREVFKSAELSMADVSESIGIPQTADTMIGIVDGGEENPDKQFLSALKSRQINKSKLKPTAVYVSSEYQRVWDIEDKRKARLTKEAKEVIHGMETLVEVSENYDPEPQTATSTSSKKNADLGDMFATPI